MSYFSNGFSTERKDTGRKVKFYGKYRAIVTNNLDLKDKMGRIKVKCPAVLGESESNWCNPCVPFAGNQVGQFFLPSVGDTVWVEFEEGDPDKPLWVGNWWGEQEVHSDVYSNNSAGLQHLIVTKFGKIHWDDQNQVLKFTAPSCEIKLDGVAQTVTVKGVNVQIEGETSIIGNLTVGGETTMNGNLHVSESITYEGSITDVDLNKS